jgi:sulfate transport system substrate-binding protein
MSQRIRILATLIILSLWLTACGTSGASTTSAPAPAAPAGGAAAKPASNSGAAKIILGGYTTPREAYGEIIPLFKTYWKDKTGQDVEFQESYQGSGAQSRAIVEGFEADVAALSLEEDITRIQKAGLITADWKSKPNKGIISSSVAVLLVRKGNPKGLKDWADIAKPGLNVLTPNPQTSGGAMWNILTLYGAAKRGFVEGVAKDNDQAATQFLKAVLKNVTVMDKGARESVTTFEKGIGDVAITYENEAIVGRMGGQDYEYVLPRSSISIDNPVAVVDKNADKHGVRQVADGFVDYLWSKDAQRIFAKYGLRVADKDVAAETAKNYPALQDLFTIDYFGGWSKATPDYFGDQGIYTQAIAAVQGQ